MSDLLSQIVERKRERLEKAKQQVPIGDLFSSMPTRIWNNRLVEALRRDGIQIIAEIKRRSPSKGVVREAFDPVTIARNYSASGAAGISVLTEEDYFDGSLDHLRAVREASDRPVLRKDFIFDEYQVYEAAHAGADAVLLIAAILTGPQLNTLMQTAYTLGLDVLVEIHDREELERVLRYDVKLLGINNRDLRTFETSLETSLKLAVDLPESITLVSESGIRTREDIDRLRSAGFHAFLIGEELMRADDEAKVLRDLVSGG
ncbi:MAG TPA: indole-3-glycerol phosphate synthase TrpC [Blastocatellia bacterium]|nr:indole-3-glycerol phosphate synthase TrpC [Blastocatellia bacterium]